MTHLSRILIVLGAAIGMAGCASTPGYYGYQGDNHDTRYDSRYGDRYARSRCIDCGTVTRIDRYDGDRRTTGVGAVTGAVIGGVLGNQVGKGDGRKAATVAGAVLGGVAGNRIEKNQRGSAIYVISVVMDDGRQLMVERRNFAGLRVGDRVLIRNGEIAMR